MLLSISILCYNNVGCTESCLNHLSETCGDREDIEFILTDNASADNTLNTLTNYTGLLNKIIIQNDRNLGFGGGHNKALGVASGDLFLVMNNDLFIYDSEWVSKVEEAFSDENIALVGLEGTPSVLNSEGHGRWGPQQDYVEGSFLVGRTSLFKKYGLFSPAIEMFLFEDSDLSLRFKQMGYKFKYIDVRHTHNHETTIKLMDPEYKKQVLKKNESIIRARWGRYLKTKQFKNKILVRFDSWGIGDAVLGTPALPALRKDHPTAQIDIETYYNPVFMHNPDVGAIHNFGKVQHDDYDRVVNMSLGQARTTPQWKVYEELAKTTIEDPFPRLFFSEDEETEATDFMNKLRQDYDIVCGCGLLMSRVGWEGRNWFHPYMPELLDRLSAEFNKIGFVLFGNRVPHVSHKNAVDLVDRTDLRGFFAKLYQCDFFIGVDSLPLHVAQAARLPGVALFGATDPSTRLIQPSKIEPVSSSLNCSFCYTQGTMPSTVRCNKGDQRCMRDLTPEKIAPKVIEKIRREKIA